MQKYCTFALLVATCIGLCSSATNVDIEAKEFIKEASKKYYELYNQIADEVYSSIKDEDDFEEIFNKIENVRKISGGLIEIATDANNFDLSQIKNEETKKAVETLKMSSDLFVLGDDYFASVLLNLAALKELATDKDIDPYLDGTSRPNNGSLAYTPDIQNIFKKSTDPEELKYYWTAWRDANFIWSSVNFFTIVDAIKKAADSFDIPIHAFWYRSFNTGEMLKEMDAVMKDIKEPYQQLHAFVRNELKKKYGGDVIDGNAPIPAHLFSQVLEQAWYEGSVIESYFPFKELPPYDKLVEKFDAKQMMEEAERFYQSLGFDELDEEFKRDRLKLSDDTDNIKNCKADIFDLTPKVYVKYCNSVEFKKFMQNHGYLSQVHYAKEKKNLPSYYFNSYDLEYSVGEAVILSASTPKHLTATGLAKDFAFTDQTLFNRLFRMGIHTLFNIPIYYVHTRVMHDLLGGTIETDEVNKHYWKLMEEYVGVEPPVDREEGAIDFTYKFFLDIEQNMQTKKFVGEVLGYQFYSAFCKKAGQVTELHNCDFYGNLAVGNDLKAMMALGSSKPWKEVLKKVLPYPKLSGDALIEYYTPIFNWAKSQNKESKVKIGWNASKRKVL
ncbi:angiotensin-converting enzyme-like [Teleopsis dalmanni]|uniref:angiotensin-converting enzyme-like n=1 Tax=Teleopsis dalmanni TaxID=139649 RepID=UPI0018CD5848|nr:angiotensin-converting enzyme-like [Teleopsis dalmanni]